MATWGDFLKDFKITNLKGTVYIHADQVLDVWEERNKLRDEAAQLREAAALERERCARDVEEFADACAAEPEQPEYVAVVLRAAAELIRGRADAPMAEEPAPEELADAQAIVAAPVPAAAATADDIPMGEPVPDEAGEPGGPETMQE